MRTLEQTMELIQENVSSIFTKEDVLELLRNVNECSLGFSYETKEDIISSIMQDIENDADIIVDKDSIKLNINSSNYITVDSVDIEFDIIQKIVRDNIINI